MRRAFLRGFAAVILVGGILGGGWLWARDASFARVTEVQITGTTTSEGDAVRAALERAAREMTTLRVREEVLDEAVASYRSVAGLRVQTDIPHGLRIHVLERRPVAALAGDGRRTAVSGDGVVLPGVQADDTLPSIDHPVPAGTRIEDERARAALAVAAAAPPKLLERAEEIYFGPEGLTADLTDGPPLVFGDGKQAAAKWAAAARVLAAPSAAGAAYLDLRVLGRVAAGGLGPVPQETPVPEPQP
ncbi:MAG: cell division protein FtsQ/DivIB [Actinomycetota bacterium]|nr:cell division protein FtsQ/DivIB [Actinomycetota bacterium]